MDPSNLAQLIPFSCCFLPRQLFVPTSCSACVWVTEQERGWRVPPRGGSCIWRTHCSKPAPFPSASWCWEPSCLARGLTPGRRGCLEELLTPSLGCCPVPGPKLLYPCLPQSGKSSSPSYVAPCVGRQQCVWAAEPQLRIAAWGLHPIPEPADDLSGHVRVLPAL